jgi:hypothetical protein
MEAGCKWDMIIVKTKHLRNAEKERLEELYIKSIKALEKKPVQKEKDLPKAGQLTAGEINDFSKWEYWKDIAAPSLINTKRPEILPRQKDFRSID